MISRDAHLVAGVLGELEQKACRAGFGDALVGLGEDDENIVVLTGDLAESTKVDGFRDRFGDRFLEAGVAEQNMMGIAAGLALAGKIPFLSSYATFSPGRSWDQFRVSVAYTGANVKVAGAHAGLSVGPDGATHQALEDIAITRVLPNVTVVVPCDYHETIRATEPSPGTRDRPTCASAGQKPRYSPPPDSPFQIGRAEVLRTGEDLAIVACGPLVYEALRAAEQLHAEGIEARVINCHTIKPLDVATLSAAARETGGIVTVEEHQVHGGLGGAVAEALAAHHPVAIEMVAMPDHFGESGPPGELLAKWGLTAPGHRAEGTPGPQQEGRPMSASSGIARAGPERAAPSGRQFEISCGEHRATVVEAGGGLRTCALTGREVLDGYGLAEHCTGARGQPLIPWPNRIEDGAYEFDGTGYQVPLTEPGSRNAIHGFLRWRHWACRRHSPDQVVMGYLLHPQMGYPFALDVSVEYTVGDNGLTVRTEATNVGDAPCPYGAGQHPYLSLGTDLIGPCRLELDAARWLPTNNRGLPTGEAAVAGSPYDFRAGREIGGQDVDYTFTGLARDSSGLAWVRLSAPGGRRIAVWADESYPFIEIYTSHTQAEPHWRTGLGVEPMTCAPNAFRTGSGLIRLEPAQSVTSRWGLCPD